MSNSGRVSAEVNELMINAYALSDSTRIRHYDYFDTREENIPKLFHSSADGPQSLQWRYEIPTVSKSSISKVYCYIRNVKEYDNAITKFNILFGLADEVLTDWLKDNNYQVKR